MKIAKLKTTPLQNTSQGILDKYYKVQNDHVFSSDEEDVTTVDNLYIFSMNRRFDYSVFRDSLRDNLVPKWAELLYEDRKKCIQHYRYPDNISQEDFDSYFTKKEHESNWNTLTARARAVRLDRLYAAFNKMSYSLPEMHVALIYMRTKQMCYDYYYAYLPHVIFWIQNGVYPDLGIDYTNDGFAQQPGYSVQLMYELLDIFYNGNYENAEINITL